MGWIYKNWLGSFYSCDTDQKDLLRHYFKIFDVLEIYSFSHFVPTPEVVTSWGDRSPDTFRTTAKLPGKITHDRWFVEVEEILSLFLGNMALLGHRVGCMLIQFQPSSRCNPGILTGMESFLKLLPSAVIRFAFEIRYVNRRYSNGFACTVWSGQYSPQIDFYQS